MAIEIKSSTPTQTIINLASQTQKELQRVSTQIATGDKYSDFKGFAGEGNVERFLSYSATTAYTKNYITSNNLTIAKINAQDQAISQIQDVASDLSSLIAQRRNSASGDLIPIDVEAQSMLNKIAASLNIKFDGRYLFSGTKTNTEPFQSPQTSNLDSSGNPTANYYYGDSSAPSIKINDYESVQYGVLGNDIGFQQLIGAVHMAVQGHTADDDALLEKAMDMVSSAVTNIASSRATLLASKQNTTSSISSLQSVNLLISENLKNVSQTDVVEATTRMSELQATIEATYLAFNRLSQLKLSNFLN